VLAGELAHKDSLGNGSTIRPGDVQRMSAGRGVQHSEFNPSRTNGLHFLQIWIQPNVRNIPASYEEKRFGTEEKRGRLRLIASPDRADGSVLIHQDARVYAGLFDGAESAQLEVASGRRIYVHVARGAIRANGVAIEGHGDFDAAARCRAKRGSDRVRSAGRGCVSDANNLWWPSTRHCTCQERKKSFFFLSEVDQRLPKMAATPAFF
jgi:redox-sensitive bicupin YhaK (pirin superfamily)